MWEKTGIGQDTRWTNGTYIISMACSQRRVVTVYVYRGAQGQECISHRTYLNIPAAETAMRQIVEVIDALGEAA